MKINIFCFFCFVLQPAYAFDVNLNQRSVSVSADSDWSVRISREYNQGRVNIRSNHRFTDVRVGSNHVYSHEVDVSEGYVSVPGVNILFTVKNTSLHS